MAFLPKQSEIGTKTKKRKHGKFFGQVKAHHTQRSNSPRNITPQFPYSKDQRGRKQVFFFLKFILLYSNGPFISASVWRSINKTLLWQDVNPELLCTMPKQKFVIYPNHMQ
jgi:hypothetical protein